MSTRCLIAIKYDENQYESIYCHWDGDDGVNGVGPTLRNHYPRLEDVRSLIALGDLSYLEPDHAEAYHRDRGDRWAHTKPRRCDSEDALRHLAHQRNAQYLYVFTNDYWQTIKIV